mmetsp:Transcript_1285/g.1564  ORF Transcript_1285/g.1564 Transcript_1285/m.1564 type:complete len:115 (+) Transcript_1285:727-1071(+)
MSIDYFSQIDEMNFKEPKLSLNAEKQMPTLVIPPRKKKGPPAVDRSNYFASVTTINGVLNGGPGPNCLDLDGKSLKFLFMNKGGTWLSSGYMSLFKLLMVKQNLLSPYLTKDRV